MKRTLPTGPIRHYTWIRERMKDMTAPRLVLFDGVCNVCNAAVNFIIDRDPEARYRFASLQSDKGRELCASHGLADDVRSIVLIEDGVAYTESTAVLRIVRRLGAGWPLFFHVAIVLPRALRDVLYRYFAHNRYRWFGQRESCRVPTPDIRRRFLAE
jgi:predicted DCC family thiol-disulfide oxidoreductase YuxK